jgi:exosome complex exonuclease RRP6
MYCDFIADKRYQLADWRIRFVSAHLGDLFAFINMPYSPLPEEMLHYARSDTHFLLYIYDNLRNALLDRAQSRASSPPDGDVVPNSSRLRPGQDPAHALVREVLNRSEDTALRRYEREMYDLEDGTGPGGWDTMAKKWNKSLLTKAAGSAGGVQKDVYRAMHAWRDRVARMEDESTRYGSLSLS